MIGIAIANSIGSRRSSGSVVVVPVATAATGVGQTSFTANWNAFAGANYYLLDVSLNSSFSSFVGSYQNYVVIGTSQLVSGLTPNTTYYYRLRAATGIDSDAASFFTRVYTAGGTLSYTEVTATETLVYNMKAAGVWTAMRAVYPMVGASAAACAQNLKSSSFTGTFTSGWTFASTGVKGNGMSTYMSTALNMLTQQPSSANVGVYFRTNNTSASTYPIAWAAVSSPIFNYLGGPQWQDSYLGTTSTNIVNNASYTGFFQRSASIGVNNRRINNTSQGTNTISYTAANDTMLLGINNTDSTNAEVAFFCIGDYITTTQQDNFYTAVQTFNQTLNRQVGAQIVSDADAQAYINRVYTAGGTLTNTEASAVNQLVIDMKSAGIWTAMRAVYPMVGSSAAACAQNLKSSSFTGTFSSGWTFASTGATPNGTSAYMDSNLNPNTVGISASSMHISNYLRTNSNGVYCDMGAYSGNPADYQVSLYSRLSDICYNDLGAQLQTRQTYSNTDSIGYYINTRTANNVFKMFKSNTLKATNTATNTATILNRNIFLGANNEPVVTQFSPRQNAFASIGDGLTDAQAASLYTAAQAFNTTLGRQVAG